MCFCSYLLNVLPGGLRLKLHYILFQPVEPTALFVSGFTGEGGGVLQIHAHFKWGMSIGTKGYLDVRTLGKLEEFKAWVNLCTIPAQAGSIQLNAGVGAFAGSKEIKIKTGVVTRGPVSKFLWDIRVANNLEQARVGGTSQSLKVFGPYLLYRTIFPFGCIRWVVKIPFSGNVMY